MGRSLKAVARETLDLLERGHYVSAAGETHTIEASLAAAVSATRVWTPAALAALEPHAVGGPPTCEVVEARTQHAARRLVLDDGLRDLVVLNYASARNPGGGFKNGAKAQEEDLSRGSGLYACLNHAQPYYTANRHERSLLYTDHMVHSPGVPFMRGARGELTTPFTAAVITAPAPNAGALKPKDRPQLAETLRRRAGLVLALAAHHGHRNLLLGAWGCGVFRNDPARVADAWGGWLDDARFAGCFDRVVFAVYDPRREQPNLRAFQARFGG